MSDDKETRITFSVDIKERHVAAANKDVRCSQPKNGHPKFCIGHRHLVPPPPPWERGKLRGKP